MYKYSPIIIEKRQKTVCENDRIECTYADNPFSPIQVGDQGTVMYVDDIGFIHIIWDNGRKLPLTMDDEYKILQEVKEDESK